jgi:hypothetical protein
MTTLTNFLSAVFPYHTTAALERAELLELATAYGDECYVGAVVDMADDRDGVGGGGGDDYGQSEGKIVFIHLPPMGNSSSTGRQDFATRSLEDDDGSPGGDDEANTDIRDQLTSLLDLASDSLSASRVILVLRRSERDDESLRVLLHSLAYVGGEVLTSPSSATASQSERGRRTRWNVNIGIGEGCDWEWDDREWVLVGIDL